MAERSLVEDAVADLLERECHATAVTAAEQSGWHDELWALLKDLGLTLFSVPEAAGGPGGTADDAWAMVELAGRYAVPLPLPESAVLAGSLIAAAGLGVPSQPVTVAPPSGRLPEIDAAGRASGRLGDVPWGKQASTVLALGRGPAGIEILAIPVDDLAGVQTRNLAGEPRADFDLGRLTLGEDRRRPAPVSLGPDRLLCHGALVRSRQMLGAMREVLRLSTTHTSDRVQFGRPLARFQAVEHHLATIAREVALTDTAVRTACSTWTVSEASIAPAAVAKIVAGRAAQTVAAAAHQVHGAIGISSEYALQVYTRRLLAWRGEFGDGVFWSRRLGAQVLNAPGSPWDTILETTACLEGEATS